jgi:glycerate 2-kinase
VILSDVTGGAAHDVGSGPSVFDPTTVADASAALERWAPELLAAFAPRLVESRKPAFPLRARWSICADPAALAAAVAAALGRAGLSARALPADSGDAGDVASRRLEQARRLAPGEAVVMPCEPTLALPPQRGLGGRAGHVALRCALDLPPDVVLLCGASDGVDGNGGTGGAIITRDDAERLGRDAVLASLAAFDDAEAHRTMGTALPGTPTGNNLTDVHVLARAPTIAPAGGA